MHWRRITAHALPLALLSFCLVTLEVTVECDPPFETTRLGFPLPWITPALFTSISFVFDPLALAFDLCVYIGVWVLLSRTALWEKLFSWRPRLLSACLWVAASAVVGFCALILSTFGYVGSVTEVCTELVRYSPHIGLPLPSLR